MKSIRTFLLTLSAGAVLLTLHAGPEILRSQQEAEARHFPAQDRKTGWSAHCVARGGTTVVSDATRTYDWNGNQTAYNATLSVTSHSGAVAAVPIGDFEPLEEFAYATASGVQTGRLVSVSIQISTGNATPAEQVMQRSVENLTKTGVPLPAATGARPGRLLPLLEVAKRRYGARLAKPRYDAPSGHVLVFLLDCRPEKADETYLPATPQGYSQKQRAEMAQLLKRSDDKGGTKIISSETGIFPSAIGILRQTRPR